MSAATLVGDSHADSVAMLEDAMGDRGGFKGVEMRDKSPMMCMQKTIGLLEYCVLCCHGEQRFLYSCQNWKERR